MPSNSPALTTSTEIEPLTLEDRIQRDELKKQITNEAKLLPIFQALEEAYPDAVETVTDLRKARLADSTNTKYDYWLSRFRNWCENPSSRYRLTGENLAIPFASLWPMGRVAEGAVTAWLTDVFVGPDPDRDPEAFNEWEDLHGQWAPATLNQAVAALKTRSGDFQDTKWEPSAFVAEVLTGLRRRLGEKHKHRFATQIQVPEIRKIARHLYRVKSPMVARYRLCFELAVIGLTPGSQARLDLASVVPGGRGRSIVTDDQTVVLDGDGIYGRMLLVAGQRRKGGNRDEPRRIMLADHPELEEALDLWLDARDVAGVTGRGLLFGDNIDPALQIKQTLRAVAKLADIDWTAKRGESLSAIDIVITRTALDDDGAWGGRLIRRRNHVMVLVGWWGIMRRSELVGLRIENVKFISERHATIDLHNTKNGKDATISVFNPANSDHAADQVVTLLREWVATRKAQGAKSGTKAKPGDFLFPSIDRHGTPGDTGLSGQEWSERLNQMAREARAFGDGNEETYTRITGHSLRRGMIATLVDAGYDAVVIAQWSRHEDVKMVALYSAERRSLMDDTMSVLWTA